MAERRYISIVTPCYNEDENVVAIVSSVRTVMAKTDYNYEHILIDNNSQDVTWDKIIECANADYHVKGIRNARNFGPGRSGVYGMFQASGDAIIILAADLQDPPELIPLLLEKWMQGNKVVFGQKIQSDENKVMFHIRGLYYSIISNLSDSPQYNQITGWGLYDKEVLDVLKTLNEPEPSLRHLIGDLGYEVAFVPYTQPKRLHGSSSYNVKKYAEYALDTLITTSQAPLKLAVALGFFVSFFSFVIGLVFLIWKLVDWMHFDAGQAPLLIGLFFIGGVLLLFIGIIGEYIGEILKRLRHFPLVIEQDRIGFKDEKGK